VRRVGCLAAILGIVGVLSVPAAEAAVPEIKHLFTIVLENKEAEQTFSSFPPSWYLGKTMPTEGALVPNYFGIGHNSLVNYIAIVSGQPPNLETQDNCGTFTEMLPGELDSSGVAVGQGCVFPAAVTTVAGQLEAAGRSWRAYMQDMANSVGAGAPATCRHPAIGGPDDANSARPDDQYATRHNPFVYFHSIIDSSVCERNVVDLRLLPEDLATAERTPAYSFIVPDLCADGHDWHCADGTSPGGYAGINAFLQEWVPRIKASPAYQDRGMILVTFDEGNTAEACCGETSGPNTDNNGANLPGDGGGRVGAVMLSPCIAPGTVSLTAYNHYSLLRWVEDNFGLAHLANAAPVAVGSFGSDVLNRPDCSQETGVAVSPRRALAGRRTKFRFRLFADLPLCREETTIRFAGRTLTTDANGEASVRLRLRGRGGRIAAAVPEICDPATATVWVKRRPRSRARVGIGGAAPVG
jgi:phosphatidylinositol-3-phosphatase